MLFPRFLINVAWVELRCLSRLLELRADGNGITDIEGLEGMRCLVKLSLKKNRISRVDFADCEWYVNIVLAFRLWVEDTDSLTKAED